MVVCKKCGMAPISDGAGLVWLVSQNVHCSAALDDQKGNARAGTSAFCQWGVIYEVDQNKIGMKNKNKIGLTACIVGTHCILSHKWHSVSTDIIISERQHAPL